MSLLGKFILCQHSNFCVSNFGFGTATCINILLTQAANYEKLFAYAETFVWDPFFSHWPIASRPQWLLILGRWLLLHLSLHQASNITQILPQTIIYTCQAFLFETLHHQSMLVVLDFSCTYFEWVSQLVPSHTSIHLEREVWNANLGSCCVPSIRSIHLALWEVCRQPILAALWRP